MPHTNRAPASLNHLEDPVPECPPNVHRTVTHRSTVIRPGQITIIRCQIKYIYFYEKKIQIKLNK